MFKLLWETYCSSQLMRTRCYVEGLPVFFISGSNFTSLDLVMSEVSTSRRGHRSDLGPSTSLTRTPFFICILILLCLFSKFFISIFLSLLWKEYYRVFRNFLSRNINHPWSKFNYKLIILNLNHVENTCIQT